MNINDQRLWLEGVVLGIDIMKMAVIDDTQV